MISNLYQIFYLFFLNPSNGTHPRLAYSFCWSVCGQGTEVSVDGKSCESSQSYAQTVSYTGSSHGKLPVSVFSLFADEEEGVDIGSSTQQTLIEDYNKHQPDIGQEQVLHCE